MAQPAKAEMHLLGLMAVTGKKPLVNAIRQTIERLERDHNVAADDPMLTKLKDNLLLRIVERDEAAPATLDDLTAAPHE